MHASGSWEATPGEKKTIELLGGIFAFCAVAALVTSLPFGIHLERFSLIFFILTFVFGFAMGGYMFYVVWKKNKEQPMEKHYYNVNYKYNGITGEVDDKTEEISKEEFHK